MTECIWPDHAGRVATETVVGDTTYTRYACPACSAQQPAAPDSKRDAERRAAWDRYAAAILPASLSAKGSAEWADDLLAERDKRFSS